MNKINKINKFISNGIKNLINNIVFSGKLNRPCFKELEFLILTILSAGAYTNKEILEKIYYLERSINKGDLEIALRVLESSYLIDRFRTNRRVLLNTISEDGKEKLQYIESKLRAVKKRNIT